MSNQIIRITLKSHDHPLLEEAIERILKAVISTKAVVNGPIPLPTKIEKFTVLTSPHVHKKAREQFELKEHKRLVEISNSNENTVDALMKLHLPSGVEVQIKA